MSANGDLWRAYLASLDTLVSSPKSNIKYFQRKKHRDLIQMVPTGSRPVAEHHETNILPSIKRFTVPEKVNGRASPSSPLSTLFWRTASQISLQSSSSFPTQQQNASRPKTTKLSSRRKSFDCDKCTKTFRRTEELQRHLVTAHNEVIFECRHCKASFTTRRGLRHHTMRRQNHGRCRTNPWPISRFLSEK